MENRKMIVVITVAAAAALAVVAYAHLRRHSPDTAADGLQAVRELAAIVLIGVKAVEGVTDVLAGRPRVPAAPASGGGHHGRYEPDYEDPNYEDL